MGYKDDEEFSREHPSYGMLHISRMSSTGGGRRLFGSPLATHYGTIRLTISKATWTHDLHHDRFFGMSKDYIDIEMSQAQFADAITSLNIGSGTPCTIRYVQGKRIDDPPDYVTESEYIRDNFESKFEDMSKRTKKYADEIMGLTSKMPAKVKRQIEIALDVMQQQINSSLPFVMEQFQEATTRITTAAKAEVDGFVTAQIRAAGLQAIAEGRGLASLMPAPTLAAPKHDTIVAGQCPACFELGDCLAQCPSAGNPRCARDHIQNCNALLCHDDDACDCALGTGVKP